MTGAVLAVRFAGPHVSIQDGGRPGLMRYGVPWSGAVDRRSLAAANAALGNPAGAAAVEVSVGGLALECRAGEVGFAVAGGGFIVEHGDDKRGSWSMATLRAGERLVIRPGPWGSWCYLAFAGDLACTRWLDSASTHALSGFGGGRLAAGTVLTVTGPRVTPGRVLPCPVSARPRSVARVTLGPQDRFFGDAARADFLRGPWRMTEAWDRMGVRLAGPLIAPEGPLDMPSEAVVRGSVQVAGDGVASILLADHQTTGGYPKIATVLDCDLDALVQLRPRDRVLFQPVTAAEAIGLARAAALADRKYLAALTAALG